MRSAHNKQSRQPIFDWVNDVCSSEQKLLTIPLSASRISIYKMGVDKSWLEKLTGVHRKVAERESEVQEALESVIKRMIALEIVIEGESASSNNMRRRLLCWYNSLTDIEKMELPLHRAKIDFKNSLSFRISHERSSKAVQYAIKQINKEHRAFLRKNVPVKKLPASVRVNAIVNDYEKPIRKWIKNLQKKPERLWHIPISTKISDGVLDYRVSKDWVIKALNITQSVYFKFFDKINSVISIMIDNGIVVHGESAKIINQRRKIYLWFNNLSSSDKAQLPIRNNRISTAHITEQIGDTSIYTNDFIKSLIDEMHCELIDMGVLEPCESFLSHSERILLQDKNFNKNRVKKIEEWVALANIPLDSISALKPPSKENPYIQLKQLFAQTYSECKSKNSKNTVRTTYAFFVNYLKDNHIKNEVFLNEFFNEFLLVDFKVYLKTKLKLELLGASHANSLLSCLRITIRNAMDIAGLDLPIFLAAEGFPNQRTTDRYKPFSDSDRKLINQFINDELIERKKFIYGYMKCYGGKNPLDQNNVLIRGETSDENAQWVFENLLDKRIITAKKEITKKSGTVEGAFVKMLMKLGGVHKTYSRWWVPSKVDADFILPYFLRLAQVTGMNSDSLCNLELDDFVKSHPATGRACIRYWKERSTGEKEYHLDIFKAKLGWLSTKQSKDVIEVFNDIKQLTDRIRKEAPEGIRNRLFIYEGARGVNCFTFQNIFTPVKNFSAKYNLQTFNIARFRPTFVSELVTQDVSLREIQLLLGHSSIAITMAYLDKLDFNKKARSKLNKKLTEIHSNVFPSNDVDYNNESVNENSNSVGDVVFKTPLASCKNIFDPPDFIKSLPSYVVGTPCRNYNKCLKCDNVIIISNHLPELFAMQRDYLELAQRNRLSDTPYGKVVEENLCLLNEMLNPNHSDFSQEELERGERLSAHIETSILVDGVIA